MRRNEKGFFSKNNAKADALDRITAEKKMFIQYMDELEEDGLNFVDELYGMVYEMFEALSENEVGKGMKMKRLSAEEAVINIIQNIAMMYVAENSTPVTMMMIPNEKIEIAKKVYLFSNDEKYKRGFIGKRQKEENERVLQCAEYGVPYI